MRVYQFRHIRAGRQCSAGPPRLLRTIRALKRGLAAAAVLLLLVPAAAPAHPSAADSVEVVVTLHAPPLAEYRPRTVTGRRLAVHSSQSETYRASLAAAQRTLQRRIVNAIPSATIRWHYSIVANGLAVVVPRDRIADLARVPGVARIWPSLRYHPLLDRTPQLIGATKLWGPDLATAGEGMKIGIIDEGVDQTHPFFNPAGFTYPAGFPKGDTAFTTPKVIVARSFPPPGATGSESTLPFAGLGSADDHGTHVAGIAAGDHDTPAGRVQVSGIAPKAYIGNYKGMAAPTPTVGLDGNSPELVAAIESAVADGMDVINLSLGEPEIAPERDIVVRALNAAADAGVVPVVAAGNDHDDFGDGTISSPATARKAIAVAASTGGHTSGRPDRIASFSSSGPTEFAQLLKPDVTAPGVGVLSAIPAAEGTWDSFSGTSMAAPHVAGGAALLRQRHPTWTVAQITSALVLTGVPVRQGGREVPVTREGGGRINLVAADRPRIFAAPTAISLGLLHPGARAHRTVVLTDAGGGAGSWKVAPHVLGAPRTVSVPGKLRLTATAVGGERDVGGFVVLTRAGVRRRIPYWFRVERPRLQLDRAFPLRTAGVYRGTTVGAPSNVARYRYPTRAPGIPVALPGPEAVYRFVLERRVANFGVVVQGGDVDPRIVRGADENRLAGYTTLPIDANPYRTGFNNPRPTSAVALPAPGVYEIVFDSARGARRGPFTFRFWIDDASPPSVRVESTQRGTLTLAVTDSGSGVDPESLRATLDGRTRPVSYTQGVARISLTGVAPGQHALVFRASDYQETKNMENTGPILPNTRVLRTTITVG